MGSGNGVLSTYKSHNQILNTDYTFPEIWPRNGGNKRNARRVEEPELPTSLRYNRVSFGNEGLRVCFLKMNFNLSPTLVRNRKIGIK